MPERLAHFAFIAVDGDLLAGQCRRDPGTATHHGHSTELAANHRRMTGGTPHLGDNALRGKHAHDVLRSGVISHQDDRLAPVRSVQRLVHLGVGGPGYHARASGQALGQKRCSQPCFRLQRRP